MWTLNKARSGSSSSSTSEDGGRTWSRYKVEPVSQFPQSYLSSLTYIILLCLTNLWHFLHSGIIQLSIWKSFFANMTIQVSSAVDISLEEHSSSTATTEMVEAQVSRIDSLTLEEEQCQITNIEQFFEMELLEESQEEPEEIVFSDGDISSSSPQQQNKLIRRDSDMSDVSTSSDGSDEKNCQIDNNKEVSPEVTEKIIAQVESMFSDEHLTKDGFLLKHVRRRSDGFVSLKLVAGLRKVKQISREFPVVMNSLRKSSRLEVNSDGTKIRRVEPLTPLLKSLPTTTQNNKDKKETTTKDKEIPNNREIFEEQQQQITRNQTARNNRNSNRQSQRKISNVSIGSSSGGSRNGSFSIEKPHPADNFRSVMMSRGSFSEDSTQVVLRMRGGSLPITGRPTSAISPSSSPPKNTFIRPKSNSYCEGTNINGVAATTMSPWLLRRKEASRNSEGNISLFGVLRQPRGPDGTKGFATGYRTLILREKATFLNSHTTLSA